ncbi:N-succinylarginine dihydrolase [Sphingopyxis microcysteis]|uniref:N-succinylarginine dihydrolase n=1 Tax=Sphingopyxis microcysteis TaxID=2484145 RepID=UPI00144880A8|nr:N-succinylarginine dihydrolase [Sphingopyxis microcysteis]
MVREVNFDGLVGPSHNYAGLSFGNVASARNAGVVSSPRKAAIQGIGKMRRMLGLGLTQGLLLPHDRPFAPWLRDLGFAGSDDDVYSAAWASDPALLTSVFSASPMWTANAATVSPAPDTRDGRCHLTVANLSSMLHRSIEAQQTVRQLRLAFPDKRLFAVHDPLPARLTDEGAANAMRLTASHGEHGLEIFVYGVSSGRYPARQNRIAGEAVARRHGLSAEGQLHVQQSAAAIEAGAFHNDVVAVANENVLLTHQQAFEDRDQVLETIRMRVPSVQIIEAPSDRVSLADAVGSYLFNSQLVTLPCGGMALVVPGECRENSAVWKWLNDSVVGQGVITRLEIVEVRESMRNGGGPACLRLRVAMSEGTLAAVDKRFLVDERICDRLERAIEEHWPERIAESDLADAELWAECRAARGALLKMLGFGIGEL